MIVDIAVAVQQQWHSMPIWVVTVPAKGLNLIARVPVVDLQKTIAMENAEGLPLLIIFARSLTAQG
jgi:hypothetical protein